MQRGSLAMDSQASHPEGRSKLLLVRLCFGNQDKLCLMGPLAGVNNLPPYLS